MLRYVAKVNQISVIDDEGKNHNVIDEMLLDKVKEVLNGTERLIKVEEK